MTSPEPTAEPAPTGPAHIFDGDCSALASVEELGAELGVPVSSSAIPWRFEAGYAAIPQSGGIYCLWESGPGEDPDAVWVTAVVLPTRSVMEAVVHPNACEGNYCDFGATAGGFELYASVAGPTDPSSLATALTARFSATIAQEPVPALYAPAGVWPAGVACETLDPDRTIGATLREPSTTGYQLGSDSEGNFGYYVAFRSSGLSHCVWSSDTPESTPSVEIDILPGGAWLYDDIAASVGAAAVSVPGFDRALRVGDTLYGFSGENRIAATLDPNGSAVPIDALYPAIAAMALDLDSRR